MSVSATNRRPGTNEWPGTNRIPKNGGKGGRKQGDIYKKRSGGKENFSFRPISFMPKAPGPDYQRNWR